MALGVILIDLTPGYNVDLMSYLFGSILAVAPMDLYLLAGLDAVILVLIGWNYHHLEAMSFDPSFARSRGVAVDRLYLLLVVLTAVTVVLVIRVVGLLLVIALVTIPPHLAEGGRRSLKGMMALAALLSAGFSAARAVPGLPVQPDLRPGDYPRRRGRLSGLAGFSEPKKVD